MNAVTTTSVHSQGGDDPNRIDRMLSDFFRTEVPAPWPTLMPPSESPAPALKTRSWTASHLALALSIAGLLVGGWVLSGRLPNAAPITGTLDDGAAKVPTMLRSGNHSSVPSHPQR